MIKIDINGLRKYQKQYLDKMKPKLFSRIQSTNIGSKYEKDLKELIKSNLEIILIGSITELNDFFREILKLYSLDLDNYFLFDYLYCVDKTIKEKLSADLLGFKSKEIHNLKKHIDNILSKKNRREYMKFNYNDFYLYFQDREVIKKIFDYDRLIGKSAIRNEILTTIDAKVCPYCGRQFITSYLKKDTLKSTAALDHFYSKSKYPFFALSLYNFIPACNTCNSLMKSSKDFFKNKHLYPYIEGFESKAEFTIEGKKLITDYIGKDLTIGIDINTDDLNEFEKIKNNIETFKLKEVYQIHEDVVNDLLYKIYVYKPNYISEISKLIKLDERIIEELIFGNPKDFEILGKLKMDILKKYKLTFFMKVCKDD